MDLNFDSLKEWGLGAWGAAMTVLAFRKKADSHIKEIVAQKLNEDQIPELLRRIDVHVSGHTQQIAAIAEDVANVRERMARLEGAEDERRSAHVSQSVPRLWPADAD